VEATGAANLRQRWDEWDEWTWDGLASLLEVQMTDVESA
jgi:hypothetical protein